jgi:hypothetical protein
MGRRKWKQGKKEEDDQDCGMWYSGQTVQREIVSMSLFWHNISI